MTQTQRFVKKLGDPHPSTIQVDLTDEQRTERRKQACDLRDQQAALVEEKKLKMAEFNHRKKELENKEAVLRGQASTGIEEIAVVVQDFLTAGNEVVSVRIDNDELVSKRTATADELQEELFGGTDEDKPH